MKIAVAMILGATLTVQPLANEDFLEPSVRGEVEHALDRAPTNAPPVAVEADFGTNGLSRTAIAIKLVSLQKSSGRWFSGTNDVTAAAVEMLRSL